MDYPYVHARGAWHPIGIRKLNLLIRETPYKNQQRFMRGFKVRDCGNYKMPQHLAPALLNPHFNLKVALNDAPGGRPLCENASDRNRCLRRPSRGTTWNLSGRKAEN